VVATGCSAGRYYPKFTTVNEVVELRGGVSLADAITSLRCKPHDVLIKQGGGYSIYNWQYKANRDYYRSLELDLPIQKKEVRVLSRQLHSAYLIFDEFDALRAVISDAGIGDAIQLIVYDNSFRNGIPNTQTVWVGKSSLKASSGAGIKLDFKQIMEMIDQYFDGDDTITPGMIYEAIDNYFN
jgi:hypothetical protein